MAHKDRYEELWVLQRWIFQSETDDLSLISSHVHMQHIDDHSTIRGVANLEPFHKKLDHSYFRIWDEQGSNAVTNLHQEQLFIEEVGDPSRWSYWYPEGTYFWSNQIWWDIISDQIVLEISHISYIWDREIIVG